MIDVTATMLPSTVMSDRSLALQIADSALRDIYFRIATARSGDDADKTRQPQAQSSTGASVDLGAIFADVFGDESGRSAPPSGVLEDRAERFAREAAEYWLENMRRIGADDRALSHFGVDRQHLGWLIDELVVGAHRLKLIDQLSNDVRALENAANAKWEDIAERQVRTAASALNGYVSALGFDRMPLDQRPGLPPNNPTRRVFESPPPPNGAPQLGEEPGHCVSPGLLPAAQGLVDKLELRPPQKFPVSMRVLLDTSVGTGTTELASALFALSPLALLALTIYVAYRQSARLVRAIGPTGTIVVVRLTAFLLFCIGIQIAWSGAFQLLSTLPFATAPAP